MNATGILPVGELKYELARRQEIGILWLEPFQDLYMKAQLRQGNKVSIGPPRLTVKYDCYVAVDHIRVQVAKYGFWASKHATHGDFWNQIPVHVLKEPVCISSAILVLQRMRRELFACANEQNCSMLTLPETESDVVTNLRPVLGADLHEFGPNLLDLLPIDLSVVPADLSAHHQQLLQELSGNLVGWELKGPPLVTRLSKPFLDQVDGSL